MAWFKEAVEMKARLITIQQTKSSARQNSRLFGR
jgi:hypothetical protein